MLLSHILLCHRMFHVASTYPGTCSATFSCVCKCCDFVPATFACHTSLLNVTSVCTTHALVSATCRSSMSLQHDPLCLASLNYQLSNNILHNILYVYPSVLSCYLTCTLAVIFSFLFVGNICGHDPIVA